MKTPEAELQKIQELLSAYRQGQYPADSVAFLVGKCIIDYDDAALIQQVPEKISFILWDMITEFKKTGEVSYYSSLGKADHTEYVRKLIAVLEA